MKRKYLIYNLGALASLAAPLATLVACGGTDGGTSTPGEIGKGNIETKTKEVKPPKTDQQIVQEAFDFLTQKVQNLAVKNVLPSSENVTKQNVLTNLFELNSADITKYFNNVKISNLTLTPNDKDGELVVSMNLNINNENKTFSATLSNYLNNISYATFQGEQFFDTKMEWIYNQLDHTKYSRGIFTKISDKNIRNLRIDDFTRIRNNGDDQQLEILTNGKDLNKNNHQEFLNALVFFANIKTLPPIFSKYPDLKINSLKYSATFPGNFFGVTKFDKKYASLPGGQFYYDISLTKGSVTKKAILVIYGFKEEYNTTKWDWDLEKVVPK